MEYNIVQGSTKLRGSLKSPRKPRGVVVFVQTESLVEPHEEFLSSRMNESGYATVHINLFSSQETSESERTHDLKFMADRLYTILGHVKNDSRFTSHRVACLATGRAASAVLVCAAHLGEALSAVVSWSPQFNVADETLKRIVTPTLMVVGSQDKEGLEQCQRVFETLNCTRQIEVVDEAESGFERPSELKALGDFASHWFHLYMDLKRPRNPRQEYRDPGSPLF